MSGILQAIAATASVLPITIPTNWGLNSSSSSTITSAPKTLTVPGGNSGSILLGLSQTGVHNRTTQYKKNSGAFTTFTNGTSVTFANGDTLTFQSLSNISGDEMDITATDNTTIASIGVCQLQFP